MDGKSSHRTHERRYRRGTTARRRRHRTAPISRSPLRVGLVAVAAATLVGSLGIGSASASRWVAIPDVEAVAVNPCTGEETSLLLHDVTMLTSGHGPDHEGFKFKGHFTTGDGVTGVFHDQDQWNAVPRPDDVVFTQLVLFRGADHLKQRVVFTTVYHVVVRDDVAVTEFQIQNARCVGRPQPAR